METLHRVLSWVWWIQLIKKTKKTTIISNINNLSALCAAMFCYIRLWPFFFFNPWQTDSRAMTVSNIFLRLFFRTFWKLCMDRTVDTPVRWMKRYLARSPQCRRPEKEEWSSSSCIFTLHRPPKRKSVVLSLAKVFERWTVIAEGEIPPDGGTKRLFCLTRGTCLHWDGARELWTWAQRAACCGVYPQCASVSGCRCTNNRQNDKRIYTRRRR